MSDAMDQGGASVRLPRPEARGTKGMVQNKLERWRLKHPEYDQMSDPDLMDLLYKKYYVNELTPSEFHERMGVPYEEPSMGEALKGAGRAALEIGGALVGPGIGAGRSLITRALKSGAGEAAGSLAAETFDPSKDPLLEAGIKGATGIAGETVGTLATRGLQGLLAPGKGSLKEGAVEAIDRLTPEGGVLTPGKATESFTLDLIENAAGASLIGGGRVARTQQQAERILQSQIDDFVDTFWRGADAESAGVLVQKAVEDSVDAWGKAARALYKDVDRLTEQATVDISSLKQQAEALKMQMGAGLPSAAPGAMTTLNDILKKDDVISFADAATLRSDLLSIARGGTDLIPGKAKGFAKALGSGMDRAMTQGAKDLSPEALQAWRAANKFWKKGKGYFNSQVLKSIVRKDPEMAYRAAVQGGRPSTIRNLRSAVMSTPKTGRDDWRQIQGQWLQDNIARATNEQGELNGVSFLKRLKSMGDDAFRELFPAGVDRATLRELGHSLRVAQSGTDTGGLRLVVQFAQAGALAGIFLTAGEGSAISGAAATFLTPYALARIITNKKAARWLTTGLRAPRGSQVAIRAMSHLGAWMAQEKLFAEGGEQ